MMLGLRSKDESLAPRCIGLSAGGFAVCLTAVTLAAGTARAESSNAIPQFASANFGWQSNLEDWEDPPTGAGHGPIKNDPAYPFRNNAEGTLAGTGATKRITNTKDPMPKPWAAAQIQATNDEILQGDIQRVQVRARHLELEIIVLNGGTESEIESALATAVKQGAAALYIGDDSFLNSRREQIAALTLPHALPTITSERVSVAASELMSCGSDQADVYNRAGAYVGRQLPSGIHHQVL
jgi:hypothetical protein